MPGLEFLHVFSMVAPYFLHKKHGATMELSKLWLRQKQSYFQPE